MTVIREDLLWHGILPIILPMANGGEPSASDFSHNRNHVERLFNQLKQSRRNATRYAETAASFHALLSLAAKIWPTDYFNGTQTGNSRLLTPSRRASMASTKSRVSRALTLRCGETWKSTAICREGRKTVLQGLRPPAEHPK